LDRGSWIGDGTGGEFGERTCCCEGKEAGGSLGKTSKIDARARARRCAAFSMDEDDVVRLSKMVNNLLTVLMKTYDVVKALLIELMERVAARLTLVLNNND